MTPSNSSSARRDREPTPTVEPQLLRTHRSAVLAIDGRDRPGSPAFQESLHGLYNVAFTVKFAERERGRDFPVRALEGLYWGLPGAAAARGGKMRWRLVVRVPATIRASAVRAAVRRLRERGKTGTFDRVQRRTLDEGMCVQALHVGPYDAETPTIERLHTWARSEGLRLRGPHHEIYLSDPHRVPPSRLKTLLRYPARPAARRRHGGRGAAD